MPHVVARRADGPRVPFVRIVLLTAVLTLSAGACADDPTTDVAADEPSAEETSSTAAPTTERLVVETTTTAAPAPTTTTAPPTTAPPTTAPPTTAAPPPTTAPPPPTTTAAPPPVPAPACTPGYDPCIPPGDDVDCAGGSGNGPRYVNGPVSVSGSDPYGLDADHDGVGCEN